MSSVLHTLIDLRRDAEQAARLRLEQAIAAQVKQEAEQARLAEIWRAARAALLRAHARALPSRETAAHAQARERYRDRLVSAATRAAAQRDEHRASALARARRAEEEARARYEAARVALEAAAKVRARQAAGTAKRARRRTEDILSDLASHAFVRRRSGS
jgi:hypothetical protein